MNAIQVEKNLERVTSLQDFAQMLNDEAMPNTVARVVSVSMKFSQDGSAYVSITTKKSRYYSTREPK